MSLLVTHEDDALSAVIVGASQRMRQLRALIRRIGPSRLPVLIVGPTGSGKELVANALHMTSGRKGAIVAFNVCAVADTMFEDALFGHKRGAFTGAHSDASGYLAEADKGTLFLDEISGLAMSSQSKLLRAIETQTFRTVGAARDRRSEFRAVAASNENLERLCDEGRFRIDLYHRLAGITIRVPALTERREDIALLANVFLRQTSAGSGFIDEDAVKDLTEMDWPGNVRQLKHVVEVALALNGRNHVDRESVTAALSMSRSHESEHAPVRKQDRDFLTVLEHAKWSVSEAAIKLGVHRATVYRRLARLNNSKIEDHNSDAFRA